MNSFSETESIEIELSPLSNALTALDLTSVVVSLTETNSSSASSNKPAKRKSLRLSCLGTSDSCLY